MANNYRVSLRFDRARARFVARAPELPHCAAEGETRAEAVARLEEEITAQVLTIRDQGGSAPVPVDEMPFGQDAADRPDADGGDEPTGASAAADGGGALTAKVSPSLHRELLYQARAEGVSLDDLVRELLAEALALRSARELGRRRGQGRGAQGRDRDDRAPGDRGRGRGRRGYAPAFLDDKASFLEYVRTLDDGRPRGGGRRGRRNRRGRPGGDEPGGGA